MNTKAPRRTWSYQLWLKGKNLIDLLDLISFAEDHPEFKGVRTGDYSETARHIRDQIRKIGFLSHYEYLLEGQEKRWGDDR